MRRPTPPRPCSLRSPKLCELRGHGGAVLPRASPWEGTHACLPSGSHAEAMTPGDAKPAALISSVTSVPLWISVLDRFLNAGFYLLFCLNASQVKGFSGASDLGQDVGG